MVARGEAPYRSGNAGELSPEAGGRADIKQFYSAGLRFKDIEPVPLSGFRRMAGSFDTGPVRGRITVLPHETPTTSFGPHTGLQTIWEADVSGLVAAIDLTSINVNTGIHSLQGQALVAGVWTNVGNPITVGTVAQAKTMALPPAAQVSATKVRMRCSFSVGATVTLGTVRIISETSTQDYPRYAAMRHDSGAKYFFALQQGFLDVFEDDTHVGGVWLEDVTAEMLPGITFYAEGATLGIGHNDLETLRVRRGDTTYDWVRDLWPYNSIPTADLGGSYAKTIDAWEVQYKWSADVVAYTKFIVDGEEAVGVPFVDASDVVQIIGSADPVKSSARVKAALEALPSIGPGVAVTYLELTATSGVFFISFQGALSGREFQLSAIVTNTADVAALATHTQIGETDFEPLFSDSRGWPGAFGFAQDRLLYGDIPGAPPAIAISQAGEYFNLNIKAAGANAARLDSLRGGNVLERVLAFGESTYTLILTDKAVHFTANRAISAEEPLNFVRTSTVGTVPVCKPIHLEGKFYYVGVNPKVQPPTGHQILSLAYSEIDTKFEPVPEHLLATHLVEGIIRSAPQQSNSKADASRIWMQRDDGRVIVASIIQSQEVLGFHEWLLPTGWKARELDVDSANDVRLCVEFDGRLRHHRLDRATFFKGTITRQADLGGVVDGLDAYEDMEVWARTAEGYVLGPFTVSGGAVDLGDAYAGDIQVGVWIAPVWEGMPRYFISRNDEVIPRPGRIHTLTVNVLESTSIAVGANGSKPENVSLIDVNDPGDAPPLPKSKTVRRIGIPGHKTGTTAVVTQVFPGELHVRDMSIGEAL